MSLPRFLVRPDRLRAAQVELTGPELRHLRVRRVAVGAQVILFDGAGRSFRARLVQIDRQRALIEVVQEVIEARLTRPRLVLAQALLKGPGMDLVIEKATELGIDAIRPYTAERSVPLSTSPGRHDRWCRIAASAAKQSQRADVPTIGEPCSLVDLLAASEEATRVVLVEPEQQSTRSVVGPDQIALDHSILVLVGPEGGHSSDELATAAHFDLTPVSLGESTLRAETAAIAAIAILQFLRTRSAAAGSA